MVAVFTDPGDHPALLVQVVDRPALHVRPDEGESGVFVAGVLARHNEADVPGNYITDNGVFYSFNVTS